jgi:hypothetical protein
VKARLALAAPLVALVVSPQALAQGNAVPSAATPSALPAAPAPTTAAPVPPAATATAAPDACQEKLPPGKERPKLTEKLPSRGTSGHAFTLTLTLEHGKGETVLPSGLQLSGESAGLRALERQGLFLPDPDGGAGPALERTEHGDRVTTKLELSFVPLPPNPGRNLIEVPPLPLSIARASGDVIVLCTQPHQIVIEDPIANTSNPSPKPNPPPRPQREEWTWLKNALLIGAVALVLGAVIAWLLGRWMKRARPVPPPPPPRPPWEVALEELFDVRHAGLVAEGRFAEHFDRVSDTLRKYLGARFGFDGLESTTREALSVLREVQPPIEPLESIEGFLRQADLVKFAKIVPSAEDGELALVRAEHIVKNTLPSAAELMQMARPAASASSEPSDSDASAAPDKLTPEQEAEIWGPKPTKGKDAP